MSYFLWITPVLVGLTFAVSGSDALAQRDGYRKPGLRPPEESGAFEVHVEPKLPRGFDGFSVVVHESQLVPSTREVARREAEQLLDLLSDQAQSQSGESLRRTVHDLKGLWTVFKKLSVPAATAVDPDSPAPVIAPRDDERIKELEGRIEQTTRILEELRRELEELKREHTEQD